MGVGEVRAVSVSLAAFPFAGQAAGTSLSERQAQHLLAGCFPELVLPAFFRGLAREAGKRGTLWEKDLEDVWLLLPMSQHPELFVRGQKPAREAREAVDVWRGGCREAVCW